MGEVTESLTIYGKQLRTLTAALIAAVGCSALALHTWEWSEPTVEKEPASVFRSTEEALLVPQPATFAATEETLSEEVKPRPANTEDSIALEKTPEQDQTHQVASSTGDKGETLPEGEDEPSSKGGSSEGSTPPPGRCDDLLALVDKQRSLPQHYAPGDLVVLASYGISTLREDTTTLRREAAESLARMLEASSVAGEKLIVASGYRSFADQQAIHTEFTNLYGKEAAAMISAPPGHSEHQLGTTVDFTNHEAQYRVWAAFENTSVYGWLVEHAIDYGFVQSYKKGKEQETGYQAESWHYRYIGVENARRLKDTDLSLQAFLLREGVVPHCD